MASAAKTTVSGITDFISCPVCLELYSDTETQPMVLQCGHSVCRKCLCGIVGSSEVVENLRIPCPECREEGQYGRRSVDQLTTNLTVKSLTGYMNLEKVEKNQVIISCTAENCGHSTNSPRAPWSLSDFWICLDCGQKTFCSSCTLRFHATHSKHVYTELVDKLCGDLKEKIETLRPEAAQSDQIMSVLSDLKEKTNELLAEIDRIRDAVEKIQSNLGAVEIPEESALGKLQHIERELKRVTDARCQVSGDHHLFDEQKTKMEQLMVDITFLESSCSDQKASLGQCVDHNIARMNHAVCGLSSRLSLVLESINCDTQAVDQSSHRPRESFMHVLEYDPSRVGSALSMRVCNLEWKLWTANSQGVIMAVTVMGDGVEGLMLYALEGHELVKGVRLTVPQGSISEYQAERMSFSFTAPFLVLSCCNCQNVLAAILVYDVGKFPSFQDPEKAVNKMPAEKCIEITPGTIKSSQAIYARNGIWTIAGADCNKISILNLTDMSWITGPSTHMSCCNHAAYFCYLPEFDLVISAGGGCEWGCWDNFEYIQLQDGVLGTTLAWWIKGPNLYKGCQVRSHFFLDGRLNLVCQIRSVDDNDCFVQSIVLNDLEDGWRLEESTFAGLEPWFVGIS